MDLKLTLFFIFIFGLALGSHAGQDIRFNDNWKFFLGDASGAQATSFSDGSWAGVCLPHTARIELTIGPDYYLGICWYRKSFTPDALWNGKKVFLEIEAAMQTADVYMNGAKLTTHIGGYKPFVLDITDKVTQGQTNVIAIRLNNNYSASFGPGIPVPDFDYFGGLYRNVTLHVTDKLHITSALFENIPGGGGIFVTNSNATSNPVTVQVKTHVRNENAAAKSCVVKTTLLDPSGQEVAANTSVAQTMTANGDTVVTQSLSVNSPSLWSPDSPTLYVVRTQVSDGGQVVDEQNTSIGIRTIKFDRTGFQINGKKIYLHGANRHQDYPYIGNAVPNSGQYRDALRLKEAGFNFVRMSHYVQSIAFVDACDRLGIVSMACVPGWWTLWDSDPAGMQTNTLLDVRNLIRYYRNHPSVVLWEVVHNESKDPASYTSAAKSAANEEYPGIYTCGENTNPGIDVSTPTEQANGRTSGVSESRPVVISEYGDWSYGGRTSTSRVLRGDGEAKMLTQVDNHVTSMNADKALSWLCGDALWSAFDYQTKYAVMWHLSSGCIDIFRLPKFSYYLHQSQRSPSVVIPGVSSGPMVFIASNWTNQSSKTITVFSNCEKVTLTQGTTVIGTQSPDGGSKLDHPPFTFTVASIAGTLKAEGLISGTVTATHQIALAGSPNKLSVTIDRANQPLLADGADIAIVHASVLDAAGTVAPAAGNSVSFSVSGPGPLVGNNPVAAEAGIASILLRAGTSAGTISVTASATGLTSGNASVATGLTTGTLGNREKQAVGNRARGGFEWIVSGNKLIVKTPASAMSAHPVFTFTLCTVQGRRIGEWTLSGNKNMLTIPKGPHGIYIGQLHGGTQTYAAKIPLNGV
jgi:beta-galactosidase